MDLTWSDTEIPLETFLERFKPPQIVQIADGIYGIDDETTLSQGQELNLHLVKDTRFYYGHTESEEEIYIPFNSPHKIAVYLESDFDDYGSVEELWSLFPSKYSYIRMAKSHKNPANPSEVIEAGELLKVLFFDKEKQRLISVDIRGCEVSLGLSEVIDRVFIPIEKIQGLFVGELYQRGKLPLTVEFMPQGSERLHRGLIRLKKIVVRQTVVATTRDTDCDNILTFPSTLDVSVYAPVDAENGNATYESMCSILNANVNLEEVRKQIDKGMELYDDVWSSSVQIIPYAEAFFSKRDKLLQNKNEAGTTAVDKASGESTDEGAYQEMNPRVISRQKSRTKDNEGYEIPDLVKPKPSTKPKPAIPRPAPVKRQKSPVPPVRTSEKKSFFPNISLRKNKSSSDVSSSSTGEARSPDSESYDLYKDDIYGSRDDVYDEPVFKAMNEDVPERYAETRISVIEAHRNIEDLTVQEIGLLLHDLNLAQYAGIFEQEQVDGKILRELDKEILQSHFQMTGFHAHKLVKASVENWRPTIRE